MSFDEKAWNEWNWAQPCLILLGNDQNKSKFKKEIKTISSYIFMLIDSWLYLIKKCANTIKSFTFLSYFHPSLIFESKAGGKTRWSPLV